MKNFITHKNLIFESLWKFHDGRNGACPLFYIFGRSLESLVSLCRRIEDILGGFFGIDAMRDLLQNTISLCVWICRNYQGRNGISLLFSSDFLLFRVRWGLLSIMSMLWGYPWRNLRYWVMRDFGVLIIRMCCFSFNSVESGIDRVGTLRVSLAEPSLLTRWGTLTY